MILIRKLKKCSLHLKVYKKHWKEKKEYYSARITIIIKCGHNSKMDKVLLGSMAR